MHSPQLVAELRAEWIHLKRRLYKIKNKYRRAHKELIKLSEAKQRFVHMHEGIEQDYNDDYVSFRKKLLQQKLDNFPNLGTYLKFYVDDKADEILDLEMEMYEALRVNSYDMPADDDPNDLLDFEKYKERKLVEMAESTEEQEVVSESVNQQTDHISQLLQVDYIDMPTFDALLWTSAQFMNEQFPEVSDEPAAELPHSESVPTNFDSNILDESSDNFDFQDLNNEIESLKNSLYL